MLRQRILYLTAFYAANYSGLNKPLTYPFQNRVNTIDGCQKVFLMSSLAEKTGKSKPLIEIVKKSFLAHFCLKNYQGCFTLQQYLYTRNKILLLLFMSRQIYSILQNLNFLRTKFICFSRQNISKPERRQDDSPRHRVPLEQDLV